MNSLINYFHVHNFEAEAFPRNDDLTSRSCFSLESNLANLHKLNKNNSKLSKQIINLCAKYDLYYVLT